ncbi:hypothetical protein COT30_03875 [Candidatus Micrarchaeota archaeon CG08_land_8_20_14_0_20_49_17]|nr:MAG: hypothetical protein AUJ13_04455 [Candidatus Micrarchaeota archaeon CG1_02_49_24]PIU09533.1 MAG: hypothetical protein COT30_03875 [Candidatus Micrarchaeota archaeon CG08_land_8_20_14_0_20_49_17]PIZ97579.1 MAG: hypothetical protein COX84_03010 [Candidatus Micrarchaeota archaeon CG_4_10_14_0_2_um_filter_49_7]HII54346.1 hypothetical protein [Candidatus Micrarchaeota archaeon]
MAKFGTAGIRGLVGETITNELAIALGGSFTDSRVIITTDIRPSGRMLKMALQSGLLAHNNTVLDMGIAPTPTLCIATKKLQAQGIVITASHNPEGYNGFKFFSNGMEISEDEQQRIEKMLDDEKAPQMNWEKVGSVQPYGTATSEHIERILEKIEHASLEKKKCKVVVDCNGSGSVITPNLLREAGATVISLNCNGWFSRGSEPGQENLEVTMKIARAEGAVALAHDGDADRCVAVDDTGEYLGLDRQLAMVADYLMQGSRNKTVISTVESGLTLREVVEKNNGKLLISKVGSGTLGRLVKQKQALFGGEPCGEYIFPELHHGADGIAVALLLAEMDAEEKLSSRKKKYKEYPIKREKFSLAAAKKSRQEVMEKIKAELPAGGELNETDGLRVDTENAFVLVRPSGTEHVIRLTCEARNDKVLADLYTKFSKLIETSIR